MRNLSPAAELRKNKQDNRNSARDQGGEAAGVGKQSVPTTFVAMFPDLTERTRRATSALAAGLAVLRAFLAGSVATSRFATAGVSRGYNGGQPQF